MLWVALLIILGLALACLEVFIPSGGVLGFLSVSSVVAAVVLGFVQGPGYGLATLGAAIVVIPSAIAMALKVLPHTPMGKRLLLQAPRGDDVLPTERLQELQQLVGKVGQAKSPMLPSGAMLLEGRTINAQSDGTPIDAGQWVRVVDVRGNRVVVQPVEAAPPVDGPEDLSQPIDTLAPDPFRDELA